MIKKFALVACMISSVALAKRLEPSFDLSVKGLEAVVATAEVSLKDGDTYTIVARPAKQKVNGKWIRRLAYNRMVPGPLLRVRQGSTVHVILKNELPLDTTLHPHGLRLEPRYDGVPGIGQPPIKPGESYTYVLRFPDYGMYWYHPHIRDDYTLDAGLYGGIIVTPASSAAWGKVDAEVPLILDDIDLSQKGQTYGRNKVTHTLMGRFGTKLLVNGEIRPTVNVTGSKVRLLLLNAANTRTYRVRIKDVPMTLLGSDNGSFQKPEQISAVTIGPGERYVIEADFPRSGNFALEQDAAGRKTEMATFLVAAKSGESSGQENVSSEVPAGPTASFSPTEIAALSAKANGLPDFSLSLAAAMDHAQLPMSGHRGGHGSEGAKNGSDEPTFFYLGRETGVEWSDEMAKMNEGSNDKNVFWKMLDPATEKSNMDVHWRLKQGELYFIRLINDPSGMHPMQHPIHFHGNRFVVAKVNGVSNPNLAWKDTVLVGRGDKVDIVLEASNPGMWMSHCHILEHIGAGMMTGYEVTKSK